MPRFPFVSDHAHTVSSRVYSSLERRARSRNERIYPLHVGDTYREPIEAAQSERQRTSEHMGMHKYAPVQGEPGLIDAFIDYVEARHGERLDRELEAFPLALREVLDEVVSSRPQEANAS